jgi:dihydrofolate reductase
MNKREVILYIAMSLDGFIATEDGDISWLSMAENPPEDYGYHDFIQTIDTVIMGRKTYDKVLSFGIKFPHMDKKCYVLSKTKSGKDENVTFYDGDIKELIEQIRQTEGKHIYCDGGAEIVFELSKLRFIDRYIVSIIPVLLGNGIRLFSGSGVFQELELVKSNAFSTGLVQLEYQLKTK